MVLLKPIGQELKKKNMAQSGVLPVATPARSRTHDRHESTADGARDAPGVEPSSHVEQSTQPTAGPDDDTVPATLVPASPAVPRFVSCERHC